MINRMESINKNMDFEQTALPLMNTLYNYALSLTRNQENAKDLLQETYLKAFRFWDTYEKGTNVKAWLYQIMKNSHINVNRKLFREPRKIEYDENQFYGGINQSGLIDAHLNGKSGDQIFGDEISQSIASLPKIYQAIVLLSDYEDFSYEEVAQIVNCPVGTVRSRLHRGRKQLQRKLADYAEYNGYILKRD